MVQNTAKAYGSSSSLDVNDCATYWMLDNGRNISDANIELELKGNGITPLPGSSRGRRVALLSRAARGLLIYENCAPEELRKFCVQRGIIDEDGKKRGDSDNSVKRSILTKRVKGDELIELLEAADEHTIFDRFLDLDPLIRKKIFIMHLSNLEYHHVPTLPPISLVSHLIRQETYPLFYDLCPAKIRIARKPPTMYSTTKLADTPYLDAVERFFTKQTHQLNRFRNVNIVLSVEPEAWKFTSWSYTLVVGEREELRMPREEKPHNERKREFGLHETRVGLNERMEELVDEIMERGRGIKFKRTDWKVLKGIFG